MNVVQFRLVTYSILMQISLVLYKLLSFFPSELQCFLLFIIFHRSIILSCSCVPSLLYTTYTFLSLASQLLPYRPSPSFSLSYPHDSIPSLTLPSAFVNCQRQRDQSGEIFEMILCLISLLNFLYRSLPKGLLFKCGYPLSVESFSDPSPSLHPPLLSIK